MGRPLKSDELVRRSGNKIVSVSRDDLLAALKRKGVKTSHLADIIYDLIQSEDEKVSLSALRLLDSFGIRTASDPRPDDPDPDEPGDAMPGDLAERIAQREESPGLKAVEDDDEQG